MAVPDAPWIRDAENNGVGCGEEIPNPDCPVCGAKEVERLYFYKADKVKVNILGCEHCIDWEPAEFIA